MGLVLFPVLYLVSIRHGFLGLASFSESRYDIFLLQHFLPPNYLPTYSSV